MVLAVLIENTGQCSAVQIKQARKNITYGKQKLFVHYQNETENLLLLSPSSKEDVIYNENILTLGLPPPLNSYIYPTPLIVVRGSLEKIAELSVESFVENCAKFSANLKEFQEKMAIYDIPLDENMCEEDESEDENDEYDETYEDGEEDSDNCDEEEWEEEEDEIPEK